MSKMCNKTSVNRLSDGNKNLEVRCDTSTIMCCFLLKYKITCDSRASISDYNVMSQM